MLVRICTIRRWLSYRHAALYMGRRFTSLPATGDRRISTRRTIHSRRHTGVPTSLQEHSVDFSWLLPVHRSNNYDIGSSNGLISSAPADHRWSTRGGGFVWTTDAHWSARFLRAEPFALDTSSSTRARDEPLVCDTRLCRWKRASEEWAGMRWYAAWTMQI